MKENIEKRVVGLFFLMLVVLAGVAWLAVKTSQQFHDTSAWVNQTHQVILGANTAASLLHAGDASMNAYLLSGDRRDQENYRKTYGKMLDELFPAVETNPSDQYHQDFLNLTNLIGQHIKNSRTVVQAREQGGEAAARRLALTFPE